MRKKRCAWALASPIRCKGQHCIVSRDNSRKIVWDAAACIGNRACGWECLRNEEAPEKSFPCRGCTVRRPATISPLEEAERISVLVNGVKIFCRKGALLIDVIRAAGFTVPSLCAHPLLPPRGACRLCLVELQETDGTRVVTSCNFEIYTKVSVRTDTPSILRNRRRIIEMLLRESPQTERIAALAQLYDVAPLSADFERENGEPEARETARAGCVLCGKCVRVAKYITKCHALEMCGRGETLRPARPFDTEDCPECNRCGACVAVCPTGVLTILPADSSDCSGCNLCLRICPDRAIVRDEATGKIDIVDHRCKECGLCIHYCPTGALRYNASCDR